VQLAARTRVASNAAGGFDEIGAADGCERSISTGLSFAPTSVQTESAASYVELHGRRPVPLLPPLFNKKKKRKKREREKARIEREKR
jgi:hypothetical protein